MSLESPMSNLGDYQVLTTAAKAAGGVEPMLASVGQAAVAKAAPRLLAVGGLIGGVSVLALGGSTYAGWHWWSQRAQKIQEGLEAERILTEMLEEDEGTPKIDAPETE